MTSLSTLHISSSGLSSYEEGLLVQQLKMLRGHTRMQWVFVSDHQAAALHIERPASSPADSADARLSAADGSPPLVKKIEMPLRVFGLIELLQECERRLGALLQAPATAVFSRSAQLAALPANRIAYLVKAQAVIVVQDDEVLTRVDSFEQLLEQVQALEEDSEIRNLAAAPGRHQLPIAYSHKRLIWALALAEPAADGLGRFVPNTEFKIAAWPQFSEWQSTPVLLRLSALFSRQFSSVEQAAAFAQADASEVRAFLLACERCGLGIITRVSQPAPAPAPVPPPTKNLLQRLRSRLGLGYRE